MAKLSNAYNAGTSPNRSTGEPDEMTIKNPAPGQLDVGPWKKRACETIAKAASSLPMQDPERPIVDHAVRLLALRHNLSFTRPSGGVRRPISQTGTVTLENRTPDQTDERLTGMVSRNSAPGVRRCTWRSAFICWERAATTRMPSLLRDVISKSGGSPTPSSRTETMIVSSCGVSGLAMPGNSGRDRHISLNSR